jgi:hypothetical protein
MAFHESSEHQLARLGRLLPCLQGNLLLDTYIVLIGAPVHLSTQYLTVTAL